MSFKRMPNCSKQLLKITPRWTHPPLLPLASALAKQPAVPGAISPPLPVGCGQSPAAPPTCPPIFAAEAGRRGAVPRSRGGGKRPRPGLPNSRPILFQPDWLPREMGDLSPRSVLVTGSNRGIGLELARQLAGKGGAPEWIFATCRDPEGPRAQDLRDLAARHQPRVQIIQLDISDPSSIKAAAATITERLNGAGLNLLFNNAAVVNESSLESETPEKMLEVYNTNVVGPMMMSQVFLPLLKKASQESALKGMSCSKAAILNVSSECGSITNVLAWEIGQIPNYRCSKAALNMLTRCQSLQYAEDKILCIALHPGWLQTDMGNKAMVAPTTVEDGVQEILKTLAQLSEKETGTFVNWDGRTLPW